MKTTIKATIFGLGLTLLMATAIAHPFSSRQLPASLSQEEISWNAFCLSRGYDPHDESLEIVNEYLDAWVGSTEEEAALSNSEAV